MGYDNQIDVIQISNFKRGATDNSNIKNKEALPSDMPPRGKKTNRKKKVSASEAMFRGAVFGIGGIILGVTAGANLNPDTRAKYKENETIREMSTYWRKTYLTKDTTDYYGVKIKPMAYSLKQLAETDTNDLPLHVFFLYNNTGLDKTEAIIKEAGIADSWSQYIHSKGFMSTDEYKEAMGKVALYTTGKTEYVNKYGAVYKIYIKDIDEASKNLYNAAHDGESHDDEYYQKIIDEYYESLKGTPGIDKPNTEQADDIMEGGKAK